MSPTETGQDPRPARSAARTGPLRPECRRRPAQTSRPQLRRERRRLGLVQRGVSGGIRRPQAAGRTAQDCRRAKPHPSQPGPAPVLAGHRARPPQPRCQGFPPRELRTSAGRLGRLLRWAEHWAERTWAAGGAGAGGNHLEGASRWERALMGRTPRSAATGVSAVPAPAGGRRSPRRICRCRARPTRAGCRPGGSASLSLRAAAHRGRAAAHHRR